MGNGVQYKRIDVLYRMCEVILVGYISKGIIYL